jgi:hypothetical protein
MDKRKELKMLYKETRPVAGVYQIKNAKNGKVLIDSLPDIRSFNGKKFQLSIGKHFNAGLQAEYNEFGGDAFTFDILETLKEKDEPGFDREKELKKLLQKHLDLLQPFGEKGYNNR